MNNRREYLTEQQIIRRAALRDRPNPFRNEVVFAAVVLVCLAVVIILLFP
jgi:hypothetical protein